jgi:hypothetical protein
MRSTICLILLAVACSKAPAHATFGAPITDAQTVGIADVAAKPEDFAGKTLIVTGDVRRACSAKGCWMEVSATPEQPGARVTFKDYGFFVPTDAQGSHARVQGVVSVKTVDAGEVAHMESEGATMGCKEADGTAKEVRIVATGVELWRG